jgi:N-acetylneuraminic acid mutarotase
MRALWPALVALATSLLVAGCPLDPFQVPGCRLAGAECDDGDPCTEDRCDYGSGRCAFDLVPEGTDCGDGNACNGIERCDAAGACLPGAPAQTDDGDFCTEDDCDPASGVVSHDPIPGCGVTFWTPLAQAGAPLARSRHSAVWSGSQMLVWGGRTGPLEVTDSGARYDAATDTWTSISRRNAPRPRHSHSAVWTGGRMLVWGGYGESDYEVSGGLYDPATDTWTPMSEVGAPGGRTFQSALWTGSELIVWGGLNGVNALADGGRYDPATDTWTPIAGGGPTARLKHAAVWSGSHMIVWGGTDTFDWLGNGALYDPALDSWPVAVNAAGAPVGRERPSSVWTGAAMIIWGGWDGGTYLGDGALYDPTQAGGGSWTPMPSDAPAGRADHVSVWTGSELFVWGGCAGQTCEDFLDDGGRFDPVQGTWVFIESDPGLSARAGAAAVWTGSEVLVWGGDADGELNDGARTRLR